MRIYKDKIFIYLMEITFRYLLQEELYSSDFFDKVFKISILYLVALGNFLKLFKSSSGKLPRLFRKIFFFSKYVPVFRYSRYFTTSKSVFLHIFVLRYISFVAKLFNFSPLFYFYLCFLFCAETLAFTIFFWYNLFINNPSKLKSEVTFILSENTLSPNEFGFLVIFALIYLIIVFHSYFLFLLGQLPNTPILGFAAKALTSDYVRYKLKKRKFKF